MLHSRNTFLPVFLFALMVACGGSGDSAYTTNVTGGRGNGEDTNPDEPDTSIRINAINTIIGVGSNGYHACAILDDRLAKCWGNNDYGQLGQGSSTNLGDNASEMGNDLGAVNLGAGRSAKAMGVGIYHTCAILDNDSVKCWGNNDYGQLGQGSTTHLGDNAGEMGDSLTAVNLGNGRSVKAIDAGENHTCAILDNNSVKCWGRNNRGQLGQGDTTDRGDNLGEMGDDLEAVELGPGRSAKAISVGGNHTCVVLNEGSVACWGHNNYGQLGYGNIANRGDLADQMGENLLTVDLGMGRTAKAISAGSEHTCAILDDDSIKCWGRNNHGQLGQGNTSDLGDNPGEMGDSLIAVNLGTGRMAKAVSSGNDHTCAILDNDSVKCWGGNSHGQLGQGSSTNLGDGLGEMGDSLTAISLGAGRTVKAIIAGGSYTCAVLDNGSVKCWGNNDYGQLGQGNNANLGRNSGNMGDNLPTVDLGRRSVKAIDAGYRYNCAILGNDSLKCWGHNNYGQLGQGNSTNLGDNAGEMGDSLTAVNLGDGRSAKAISAGGTHTCAILDNDSVKCWGRNNYGQLGQGNTTNLGDNAGEMGDDLDAVNLGEGRSAKAISAGGTHTCAILDNDSVKCWGRNTYGQLGQGNTTNLGDNAGEMGDSLDAVNLGDGRSAKAISAGGSHTCVVLDDDSVKCWGHNNHGQLGQGNTTNLGDNTGEMGDSLTAVNLGTGRSVKEISTIGSHTCAILDNNSLKCWGRNDDGQLGKGDTHDLGDGIDENGVPANEMGDSLTAVSLGTGRTVKAIGTGSDYTCAVLDNNSLKCWGGNLQGQLGQGNSNYLGDGPNEMGNNLNAIALGTGRSAKMVTAGDSHTCSILDNDLAKCWGSNSQGELGQENTTFLGDGPSEMGNSLPIVDLGSKKTAELNREDI